MSISFSSAILFFIPLIKDSLLFEKKLLTKLIVFLLKSAIFLFSFDFELEFSSSLKEEESLYVLNLSVEYVLNIFSCFTLLLLLISLFTDFLSSSSVIESPESILKFCFICSFVNSFITTSLKPKIKL